MKRICVLLLLAGLLGLAASGCGSTATGGHDRADRPPLVVTTIYPVADITRQIGGDMVRVVNLIPAGASPHTFEPTPGQMSEIAGAAAFITVGAGLDDWAATLAAAGAPEMVPARLADGLTLADGDPHIWLDPLLVRDHVVPAIAAVLTGLRPDEAENLEARAAAYRQELTILDRDIRDQLGNLENPRFIAFHPAWRYFAARYDLIEAAVVEPAPGKEPSARWIAQVVETARETDAGAIFAEPQFSTKAAAVIAQEFGAEVLLADPLGGAGLEGKDSYLALMRTNAAVFRDGLK